MVRGLWATMLVADCVAAGASSTTSQMDGSEDLVAGVRQSKLGADRDHLTTPFTESTELPARIGENRSKIMFDDFEVFEEIGRGGMGVVYKANQLSLGRTVAIKVLLRGQSPSSADLARFRTEAESAAKLDHPAIVPIYEVGEQYGQPYFTMKYVPGTTLTRQLAEGPITARQAASILAPICRAVHYAHQRGVLHRDLKPSNILIDEEGRPHVSDFGLAKRVEAEEHLTLSGAVLGTPSYMSPEQAAGKRGNLGPGSDVYSLGTILYQMLTGHPPFQAATPVETVLLVLEQEPLPPRLLNPRADRELELIAAQVPAEAARTAISLGQSAGRRSRRFFGGRTDGSPLRYVQSSNGPHVPRDAPRNRAGELGLALDMAQSRTADHVLADQPASVERHNLAMAISGFVDGWAGDLGHDLLDAAASLGAGDLR